jgi:hypothetical protein
MAKETRNFSHQEVYRLWRAALVLVEGEQEVASLSSELEQFAGVSLENIQEQAQQIVDAIGQTFVHFIHNTIHSENKEPLVEGLIEKIRTMMNSLDGKTLIFDLILPTKRTKHLNWNRTKQPNQAWREFFDKLEFVERNLARRSLVILHKLGYETLAEVRSIKDAEEIAAREREVVRIAIGRSTKTARGEITTKIILEGIRGF